MIGVIGASDKTPLTVGTGNKEMHPVLLSLANIHAGVRMKATSHAFALAAYLPIPKFIGVAADVQAVLSARIYHLCLTTICENLINANRNGALISDPWGRRRICRTPLASWIADLPEQRLLACVLQSQSPISTATHHQFGDGLTHTRRTRSHTLALIDATLRGDGDPELLLPYLKACKAVGLNGVHQPFWRSWGRADPSTFLTPDALHQWHKFFYDHPVKWIINILGAAELDQRMAAIQPRVGVRHWPKGVSNLKQLTGREHRDLEKILVVVAAGGVADKVLQALRALVEFIFLAQSLLFYPEHFHGLKEALKEFHAYKNHIYRAGGRRGKKGHHNHFNIPKLELMQGVEASIRLMGASYQYTSDITERCHITHVKTPYRMSNKREAEGQCCLFMGRSEKVRQFSLYASLRSNGSSLVNEMVNEASQISRHYPEALWLTSVLPAGQVHVGTGPSTKSLFLSRHCRLADDHTTAFTVTIRPHYPRLDLFEAAALYKLQDFRSALGDYFVKRLTYTQRGGQRKSAPDCSLPFTSIRAWNSFRIQQYSTQDPLTLLPARTVQALPPNDDKLPYGRCNTVILDDSDDSAAITTTSADTSCEFTVVPCVLLSHICHLAFKIAQIRCIFSPGPQVKSNETPDQVYLYIEYFRFSPLHTELVQGAPVFAPVPGIDMFQLHRHYRNDGVTRMGDVVRLVDVRNIVELVPRYGSSMDPALNCNTSLDLTDVFYLNNFADKETFHAILSYQ